MVNLKRQNSIKYLYYLRNTDTWQSFNDVVMSRNGYGFMKSRIKDALEKHITIQQLKKSNLRLCK